MRTPSVPGTKREGQQRVEARHLEFGHWTTALAVSRLKTLRRRSEMPSVKLERRRRFWHKAVLRRSLPPSVCHRGRSVLIYMGQSVMSEFDRLRALLDLQKDTAPALVTPRRPDPQSIPKAASHEPESLRSPTALRRRRLWLLATLLVITAIDAVYLLAKALIAVPR
jgi:hypothetical protein